MRLSRRRRAVRRSLRVVAAPRAQSRSPRRRAPTRGRVDVAGRSGRRVRSTRLVSFVQRSIAAIRYEVEAVGRAGPASSCSQRSSRTSRCPSRPDDPRAAAALRARWSPSTTPITISRWRSGIARTRVACAWRPRMDHVVNGPAGTVTAGESEPDLARVTVSTELAPGQSLRVVKFLGVRMVERAVDAGVRDQVDAALVRRQDGPAGTGSSRTACRISTTCGECRHRDRRRRRAAAGGAIRALPGVQAGARAEQRAIPAKGLTGRGYDGHTFWDMETYTLPVLTYTAPDAARDALRWRHSTLDSHAPGRTSCGSRAPRSRGGRSGARSARATGPRARPLSTSTPTSPMRFGATSAATGRRRVRHGTRPRAARRDGAPVGSLGHHDAEGRFRIDGVTGPDEYSALVDNNVFTNLMAARNLEPRPTPWHATRNERPRLGVDEPEFSAWRAAADAMVVPFDDELGVTAQSEGFTRYRHWDFAATPPAELPAAAPLPLLPAVLEPGRQASRSRLRALRLRRLLRRRAEARDFDYYERDHRPRLVAVREHPGDRRRRGRAPPPRIRLLPGDGAHRPARPRRQHSRWLAPRVARRGVARRGRRVRRPAGPRRHARVRAPLTATAQAAVLQAPLPRPPPTGRGRARRGALRAPRRGAARRDSPRQTHHAERRVARNARMAGAAVAARSGCAAEGPTTLARLKNPRGPQPRRVTVRVSGSLPSRPGREVEPTTLTLARWPGISLDIPVRV